MRRHDDVRPTDDRRRGCGLPFHHVQSRCLQQASIEGSYERLTVDEPAAADVDQDRLASTRRKKCIVDEMMRRGGQRQMQRDRVGLPLDLVNRCDDYFRSDLRPDSMLTQQARRVHQHACSETPRQLTRGRRTDSTVTDDPHRHIPRPHQARRRWIPAAELRFSVERSHSSPMRQEHRNDMVRNLFDAIVGYVSDPSAARGGRGNGDIVEPDTESRDDAQIRRRLDRARRDRGPTAHDRVRSMLRNQRFDRRLRQGFYRSCDELVTVPFADRLLDRHIGPRVVGDEDFHCVGSDYADARRLNGDVVADAARSADKIVLCSNIVTVICPTPPGTGVMYEAFSFTPSKSTSPTMRPSGRRL